MKHISHMKHTSHTHLQTTQIYNIYIPILSTFNFKFQFQLQGQAAGLLQVFDYLLIPGMRYIISIAMSASGLSTFVLADTTGKFLEAKYVQHKNTCPSNFASGYITALFFGGTCAAPTDVSITYSAP